MSEPHVYDLDAYKNRIGYLDEFQPTLEVLQKIAERHVCSIPFENLSVLLRQPIDLASSALEQKLIHEKRGGYCFEQNGMMLGILRQIGFEVRPLSGRVRIDRPRDLLPPRTHLFLAVNIEEREWIFDAGVGSLSLTSPILLNSEDEQLTQHETRRITRENGKFYHQALLGDTWKDTYEFTGEEMAEIDCEVSNWWTSTSPNAKFSQNLMVSLAMPYGERIAIINDRFTHRRADEVLETFTLDSADSLLQILHKRFGLTFEKGTRFRSGNQPWPTN
jgi:N-hydroxyarylamine O-acetyltransferase